MTVSTSQRSLLWSPSCPFPWPAGQVGAGTVAQVCFYWAVLSVFLEIKLRGCVDTCPTTGASLPHLSLLSAHIRFSSTPTVPPIVASLEKWLQGVNPTWLTLLAPSPFPGTLASHISHRPWTPGLSTGISPTWIRSHSLVLYSLGPPQGVLRVDSWLYSQGSLLAVLGGQYGEPGIEFGSTTQKANPLSSPGAPASRPQPSSLFYKSSDNSL